MEKYDYLKQEYPNTISLNQLYQICHISKRSARYLVQHEIIPCTENSGHRTWRYQIALDDVITYLIRREQFGSMIPCGAATSPKNVSQHKQPAILSASEHRVEAYFKRMYAKCPDALTVSDIAAVTGLCKATIRNFIRMKHLNAISEGKTYYIPKLWFIEFTKSQHFLRCAGHSDIFKSIINGFG